MKTRKCRRKRWTVILLFNAFFIFIIFISSYHHTNRLRRLKELRINKTLMLKQQAALFSNESLLSHDKKPDEVVILYWTTYFGGDPSKDSSWILTSKRYPTCFDKCRLVFDKTYIGISDAVIFHSRDIRKIELPIIHPSHQMWVYLQQESPSYSNDLKEYNNVFNWTMTYRHDSDIYHPYFLTVAVNTSTYSFSGSQQIKLQRKTKLVAWVVSNCHTKSKRENYVAQLSSYIPIDIYGSCGDYSCDRSGEGCFPRFAYQYKFYLSFENSLCRDYITEKFSNALKYNLVPIVYGAGDYSAVAPPNSFINAHDFANPRALAEYLLHLDRNPKLYLQYFQWKAKYKVVPGNGLCSLCRKTKEQKRKGEVKVSENLSDWWNFRYEGKDRNKVSVCQDPAVSLTDSWNLIGMVDVFKYMRRWFYKQVLGY